MNETMKTFRYPETLVKEFQYWAVLLRPEQTTIGSLILINKSNAKHLGELSCDEWAEFAKVSKFAENLLRETFGAEKFNYPALMMFDPNVHFHLIPRYSRKVKFADQEFTDPDWPARTQLADETVSDEIFAKILEKLKNNSKEE